ncbi:pimeloyl-ACP methyl ester carboxylesterase [Deinobacterium chartae]|uniref:Pimeloyl-ACP methyl ester carboxylesterase n=1 Tax=Deinobacterium chartae TaxID=521158 RepID=A0A841HZ70_9DEIO|nr:alpha/beta hydrolase [Deinobacterium chartae]MBB6097509.1 pimeloyl-ACP methyl ester carboxylesterase [Deinobacterium chartae]
MHHHVFTALTVSALLGAASAQTAPAPRNEACPYLLPQGMELGRDIRCGYASVPLDHAQPYGRQIQLAYVVLEARSSNPRPDPLFVLLGGPGQRADSVIASNIYASLARDRDVVIFDQRGVGQSRPALACPELSQLSVESTLQGTPLDATQLIVQGSERCLKRLEAEGVDLKYFNTRQNADDVEALRRALGYDRINLYGGSYGTLLGQRVLERHPHSVRAAVLDGVAAPGRDYILDIPLAQYRALDRLFAACAQDPGCPLKDPWGTLEEIKTRLDREPVQVKLQLGQESEQVALTGEIFMGLFAFPLYGSPEDLIPLLVSAQQGDYRLLEAYLPLTLIAFELSDWGMRLGVACAENMPFSDPATLETALASTPEFFRKANLPGVKAYYQACALTGVPADARNRLPVRSSVPTLFLNGEFDPATPPENGERAARTFSHAQVVTVRGGGHTQILPTPRGLCATNLVLSFLNAPTRPLDTACAAQFPARFDQNRQ